MSALGACWLPRLAALTAAALLLAGGTPATARRARRATSPVPVTGDWEGTGPHGLPLSFALARRRGHVVASEIAVGYPGGCPTAASDAYVAPLIHVGYAGPGGLHPVVSFFAPPGTVALTGRVARVSGSWQRMGRFATRRSGTLTSASPEQRFGCGWPARWLTWHVHRATRTAVADGRWNAQITGPNITGGTLTLTVAAGGRAVTHIAGSFSYACPDGGSGPENFEATWGEFVRPDGSFGSPQDNPIAVDGVPITWTATFSRTGELTGSFTTAGPAACGPTHSPQCV
ncbi:MAG TPA: hypothetical protein VKV21_03315 [Solirubrobacteraceae bacterium]|nr:hypothetical protein [Solirubrobacteraceae bacterium]